MSSIADCEKEIVETAQDAQLRALVHLACELCGMPIGIVSRVDPRGQWVKIPATPRIKDRKWNFDFCKLTIVQNDVLTVEDASLDTRFFHNPSVTAESGIRFYAGVPVVVDHVAVATLCVADICSRRLSEGQKEALRLLAVQAAVCLRLAKREALLEEADNKVLALAVALQESNNLFAAFMHNSPLVSYIKDSEGRFVFYNKETKVRFCIDGDQWIGLRDHDVLPKDVADVLRLHDLDVLDNGVAIKTSEVSRRSDGENTFWTSYKFPFRGAGGALMLGGMSVDVTSELLRKAEMEKAIQASSELALALEANRALLQAFHDNSPNHAFIKSEKGHYVSYNKRLAEYFGVHDTAWIDRSDHDVMPQLLADAFRLQDLEVLSRQQPSEVIQQMMNSNGKAHTFRVVKFPLTDALGLKLIGGVSIDITAEVDREAALCATNTHLSSLATTDALTRLPNRSAFESWLKTENASFHSDKATFSVMAIAVDEFGKWNDSFGQRAGDVALQRLAKILTDKAGRGALVARLEGVNFSILLPKSDFEDTQAIAIQIRHELASASPDMRGLTISIGSATSSSGEAAWAGVVLRATEAMLKARTSRVTMVIESH